MAANGAPLYGISVQNEPDWEAAYEGCVWTAAEMRDFLKNQGAIVNATRLMAPELVNNNQTYLNTILSDPDAVKNLKIIGTHLYGGGLLANETAAALGKEVWMTEHLDTLTSFAANLNTAIEIHDCFTKANFSAYIWWYGKRFYGLLDQQGEITQRGYMVSQFSRFIRNGAVRLGTTTNTRNDVLISAYKNGTKKVIVFINWGGSNVTQTVNFQNLAASSMQTYITTAGKNVALGELIPVNNGSLTCLIPTRSIVTLVEQ